MNDAREEAVMEEDRQQRILVGVDGSSASAAALGWASAEAMLRTAKLHVVRAWDPARHVARHATAGAMPPGEETQHAACAGLAAAMRAAFGPTIPTYVMAELAEGVPERVLTDRSARADLLVLGVSAAASQIGRSAGPVVRSCFARARCPVVIVTADGAPTVSGRALADVTTT
jgi:nucleotide-binding universal stress UspA family protein